MLEECQCDFWLTPQGAIDGEGGTVVPTQQETTSDYICLDDERRRQDRKFVKDMECALSFGGAWVGLDFAAVIKISVA